MYADTSSSSVAVPLRMQRAEGRAAMTFHRREGATRLKVLFQEGCAKVRLPVPLPGQSPEAILINTAGGLAGGDRLTTQVMLEAGASAVITTQACERAYRSLGTPAVITNSLRVSAGARLAWLPQETILFDGGRLQRSLEVDLEGTGEFVAVEAILFGRTAMGETVRSGALHDRWRIRRDGEPIFADDFRIEGRIAEQLARPAVLDGHVAMATVLYAGPEPERFLEPARHIIGEQGGASAWNGKFLARLLARTGLGLRRLLEPLLTLLLAGQPLPKAWLL